VGQAQKDSLVGMDQFGDIIIGRNELVLMRGGWSDRYGTKYSEGVVDGRPCALNITIRSIVPNTFTNEAAKVQKSNLIKNNNK
jgi:hypothetical protein